MTELDTIRVLLVEDDEDDCFLAKELIKEIKSRPHQLDWARTYDAGLKVMALNKHDVCLVDYRLGPHTGLELMQAAKAAGAEAPVILLTGQGKAEIDLAAMKAGASDYLTKGQVDSHQLERTIRYAIERKRAASLSAFEQARLAAFGAQVGLELTRRAPLEALLGNCAQAMTQFLNCALAEIWIYDSQTRAFIPCAQAGAGCDDDAAKERPLRPLNFLELVQGKPVFFPWLAGNAKFPYQAWAEQQQFVSFAAYPLVLEDRPVGCISIFARETLAETVLQEIGSVANGVALCIQRKRDEAQVQKLAAFPRVSPNPVLEFSADGKLTYANDAAFGLTRSLGKTQILDLLPERVPTIVAECLAGGLKKSVEEVSCSGHTLTWSFFPVPGSHVVHCYGADITEMLNLEAQYRHAQKLESVGQLAAGIAHDFNNLLTVIQGYTDCLLTRPNADSAIAAPLKQIAGAAKRAAALTRQLLTFSRKQILQARPLDLNTVLRNLANMLPRLLGEDIALETQYAAELPSIEADSGMIEQVVMNLAVNARDAMPKGGQLIVSTTALEVTEDYVRQRPDARPGQFVCLSVKDTGSGMDAKTLARIFEPFFSTKEVGRGTGLGLATVYGIIKQHQGWVEVASEVGVGTTFKIFFPAATAEAPETEEQTDGPQSVRGGHETILLVEDETVLRDMVGKVLRDYEYNVLEAATGVEALKVWDEQGGKIDLLLTDMVMPGGISGGELSKQLRRRKPDLKVIYSSGYSSEIVGKHDEGDTEFLAKPYRPPILAQKVRKCLDAEAKPSAEPVTA